MGEALPAVGAARCVVRRAGRLLAVVNAMRDKARLDAIRAINFWLTSAMRSYDETELSPHTGSRDDAPVA
jgi:hypothetical protein